MNSLWLEQVWRMGKRASEAMYDLDFFHLLKTLESDFAIYLEAKKIKEEVFDLADLSREELIERSKDVQLLIDNLEKWAKTAILRAYISQGQDAEKMWGQRCSERVQIICGIVLPAIQKEITFEMLLREGKRFWLEYILEKDWNPRRKKFAQQMIEKPSV